MIRTLPLLFTLAAALLGAGCGYRLGYRVPSGARSIGIPVFRNATFPARRDLEYELTSLVRREFQGRTDLEVVGSQHADLVLRGTIVRFRERLVADGQNNQKIESSIDAEVSWTLEDYISGHRRSQITRTSEPFSPGAGEEFDSGRRRALENLAERIVAGVEHWGFEESDEQGFEATEQRG